jgi:hypothetical protein
VPLWLVNNFIPMAGSIKSILNAVVVRTDESPGVCRGSRFLAEAVGPVRHQRVSMEQSFFVIRGNQLEPAFPVSKFPLRALARFLRLKNVAVEHVPGTNGVASWDNRHPVHPPFLER